MAQDDETQKILSRLIDLRKNGPRTTTGKIIYFGSDSINRVVTTKYTGPDLLERMFNEDGSYNPDYKKEIVITIR